MPQKEKDGTHYHMHMLPWTFVTNNCLLVTPHYWRDPDSSLRTYNSTFSSVNREGNFMKNLNAQKTSGLAAKRLIPR